MRTRILASLVALSILLIALLAAPSINAQDDGGEGPTEFHIRGASVQAIGQYPDSFSYDGSEVRPQEWGFFEIHIDAETDTGLMFARFHLDNHQLDSETLLEDSTVTVIYPLFGLPTDTMPEYWEGGIADYTFLHGDSGQEAPVLPTIWNTFGSWGPSLIFVDGEQYMGDETFLGDDNVFGFTTGHTMYSANVRNPETGEVLNADGSAPFSPMEPGNGSVFDEEVGLLHVVAHTDTRDAEAFPPFTMFLHINFYDVEEIEPIEDLEYLTWETMAELDADGETWEDRVAGWLELVDAVQEELFGEEDS